MTDAVAALREEITDALRESGIAIAVDGVGDFMVEDPTGSAVVWIRPVAGSDGRSVARVWAVTNVGMRVDAELTKFLLATNARWPVGGFRLDEQAPAVVVAHSLLGESLDQRQLLFAIAAVAAATQQFAGEIQRRFGGQLFGEA